jgi:arabinose-5-phosphate isomerase
MPSPSTSPELDFARGILHAEAAAITGVTSRLTPAFTTAVDLITRCADQGGSLLVSGLGKSGLIGAKIAATFSSLGIASHPVHPTEAVHGDLGRFRPADCCLALSYSGETDEVVALAALLRQDNIPIISITRGGDSTGNGLSALERLASASLTVGHVNEAGDVAPAPTCSTTATLALADALALAAARRRNFTHSDFAKRHPGGALGGLLRPVTDILRFQIGKNLAALPDDLKVADALTAAESGRRPGALLLVHPATGVLTGIFTDADLRRLILRGPNELARPIRDLMTKSPATLPHTALVRDAVVMVRESRRDEIPVIDAAGKPLGILDVQDLIAMKLIQSD